VKNERGQVMVLALGLVFVCFAVGGLAVDGTKAFLYRRTLQNAADAAALAGAAELDRRAYYSTGGNVVDLDARAAEREVVSLLGRRGLPTERLISVRDGRVLVSLRGHVDTSFLRLIGISRLTVGADSAARPIAGSP
jgi:hypothetical protein